MKITGDNPWTGTEEKTYRVGPIANIKNFVAGIRSGNYLNNAAVSVESNLTAVLGRMAAYGQRPVTWAEMTNTNEKLEANLVL